VPEHDLRISACSVETSEVWQAAAIAEGKVCEVPKTTGMGVFGKRSAGCLPWRYKTCLRNAW